jgi:hypothetical protein
MGELAPGLGGTFPNFAEMYADDPREELRAWARAIFGDELDQLGNSRWWHVDEVSGITLGGLLDGTNIGGVTNGRDYYVLDWDNVGIRRIDIAPDGSVFGNTVLYRSNKTGELRRGGRTVFWD